MRRLRDFSQNIRCSAAVNQLRSRGASDAEAHAPVDGRGRVLNSDLMKGQPFCSTVPNLLTRNGQLWDIIYAREVVVATMCGMFHNAG